MIAYKKFLAISDELLQFLLDYRSTHPEFKFWLRSRESSRSEDKSRLQNGQWFQGSDYIFISFHSGSGGTNMTRSIGWVMTFNADEEPNYNIEIVWNGETDVKKKNAYRAIIERLGGFTKGNETKYYKFLPKESKEESLRNFIENILPVINEVIFENDALNLFIPDAKFERQLSKVLQIRSQIASSSYEKPDIIMDVNSNPPHALNTILYGPPGTGKTYSTIQKAISIINPKYTFEDKSRADIKAEYDRLVNAGQIVFTTFHQSLSYEDFIEGIKPRVSGNDVLYEVQDGVFKDICNAAYELAGNFDEVLAKFKGDISESDGKEPKPIEAPSTHFSVVYRGTNVFYVQPKNTTKSNPWYPVNIANIRKAFETDNYTGIYNPTYVREIINHLVKEYKLTKGATKKDKEPYVLIIDEINRGNVAQIFGELITLIEAGKRKGQPECIELTLPYSKELFSVPSNIYLLGTMNTADRSIEALDTALRRRFAFEEMLPQAHLLSPQRMMWQFWWDEKNLDWKNEGYIEREDDMVELLGISKANNELAFKKSVWEPMLAEKMREYQISKFDNWNFTGVNLEKMLIAINNRLNVLLDKDRTIGHAWFMKVRSLADLKQVFEDSIIPLLQEFFYNDYGKIGLVIGEAFFEFSQPMRNVNDVFAKFSSMDSDTKKELLSKPVFKIKMPQDDDLMEAFKQIYSTQLVFGQQNEAN